MLSLEKIASDYFKTNIKLQITPQEEESFKLAEECWLCEEPFEDNLNTELRKVRDHDHLTGKNRGAANNICIINCKQMSSSFVPIFFHTFSGYDCNLIFEQLLTESYNQNYNPTIIPKCLENCVSVQVGCLRFLDSYRFLSSGLDKLVKSLDNFIILVSNNLKEKSLEDDLLKKKLAYPYEYLNLSNFQEPLNLEKENFRSTLKQSYPSDEEINRRQEIIEKDKIKNGQELTVLYLKMDVLQLADVFKNFVESSTREYKFNPLYSYSLPGYTWKVGLKLTNKKLDFSKHTHSASGTAKLTSGKNYYYF